MTDDAAKLSFKATRPRMWHGHPKTTVRAMAGDDVLDVATLCLDDRKALVAYSQDKVARFNGRAPGEAEILRFLLNLAVPDAAHQPEDEAEDVGDPRPLVDVGGGDLAGQKNRVFEGLVESNQPATLFVYGGLLARVERDDDEGALVVRTLDLHGAGYEIAERVRCVKVTEEGESTEVLAPLRLVQNIMATPRKPLPVLRGVTEVPVFAATGRLLDQAGYDLATGLYYDPSAGLSIPRVPPRPSDEDVTRARELLLGELLCNFPFVEPADRANAMAALLEQFVRPMIRGSMPLHDIEAPSPGSGKGLLAEMLAVPFVGDRLEVSSWPSSEEERRKQLTSVLAAGRTIYLIDNVSHPLISDALNRALTARTWVDRPLGQTALIRAPVRLTWLLTGNNPFMDAQTARRSVPSRLDTRMEQPWTRAPESFRHADLRTWALDHRGELVWAALTLIQAWVVKGQPQGERTLGSFESWARVLGGILEHAGIPGFLDNVQRLYCRADAEGAAWRELVKTWWATYDDTEVGVSEIFELAKDVPSFDFGRATSERGQRTVLGQKLAQHEDQIIGDYCIARSGELRHTGRWKLLRAGPKEPGPAPTQGLCVDSQKESTQSPHAEASSDAAEAPKPAPEARQKPPQAADAGQNVDSRDSCGLFWAPSSGAIFFSGPETDKKESIAAEGRKSPQESLESTRSGLELPPVRMITSAEAVREALPALLAAPALGVDVETTGTAKHDALDPLKGMIRLVQLATREQVYLVDAFTVDVRLLRPLFESGQVLLGHNIGFDLRFLEQAGLPVPTGDALFDTLLATQLVEASADKAARPSYKLEHVASRLLGVEMDKTLQRSDWSGELSQEQLAYAGRDAIVLLPLYDRLIQELTGADLMRVALLEMQALPAVVWLEQSGAPFDIAAWRALSDGAMEEHIQLEQELAQALGDVDLFGVRGIKWSSAVQVLRLMQARGHDVQRVDEDVLQDLASSGEPLAPLLLRYRDATKRVSTYGIKYLKHVHPRTGRIHARYRQLGSEAGRMSCTDPNLQQVPTAPRYRACFRPAEGRALVKADYSQIELRLAAEIAGDARLIEAFQRREDLHAVTARQVLGKTQADLSASDRKAAKAINFGLIYAMGAKTLRDKIAQESGQTVSIDMARALRDRFFATYRGLRAWQDKYREPYGQQTPIETRSVLGRRRLRVGRLTEKCNTPVQASGSDGFKAALALLWESRDRVPDAYPVLAVHDELVVETALDRVQETAAWLEQCMTEGMAKVLQVVPVEVEVKTGPDWSMG